MIFPALKTGKLELRSNAVVARILVNDKGLAEGVQYFDRQTGREERVYAKVVVMGASAVDTTRILLNSKSTAHPNGLGNGSDVIGRYLCEQLRVPTLLLYGAKTRLPAKVVVEVLDETLPLSRAAAIPGAGHMSPFTHRDAVNAVIAEHIEEVDRAAA